MAADNITNTPVSPCRRISRPNACAIRARTTRSSYGAPPARHPPGGVKHRRTWPGHVLHHHEAQRFAGHVDTVTQCVGAEQRRTRIVAEDID